MSWDTDVDDDDDDDVCLQAVLCYEEEDVRIWKVIFSIVTGMLY